MALNKTDYLKQLDYMYQLYKHKDLLRNQIHPSSKTSERWFTKCFQVVKTKKY